MITEEFQRAVLAQYTNSERLYGLLESLNYTIDPRIDIEKFFTEIFDLDTCGSYGLDVWARIVAAPRAVTVFGKDYFGFRCTRLHPFNQRPFYNGQRNAKAVELDLETRRALIYFKAACNIVQTTEAEINRLFWEYFDIRKIPGEVIVSEIAPMTIRVLFRFKVPAVDRAIFRLYGRLLKPGGVEMVYHEISGKTFGFAGSGLLPFGQGRFFRGAINQKGAFA